jgi:hypothetical protein
MWSFLWELLQRAWYSSVAAMGTTTLAILVGFVAIPIILLVIEWATKGWDAMKERWQNNLIVAGVTLCIWIAIFAYRLFFAVPREIRDTTERTIVPRIERPIFPPQVAYIKTPVPRHVFTKEELAEFGNGIAVQLLETTDAEGSGGFKPLGTGFWISSEGYIATCLQQVLTRHGPLVVGIPIPALLSKNTAITLGVDRVGAELIAQDQDNGIAIVRVLHNPFDEREIHAWTGIMKAGNKKGNPPGYSGKWIKKIPEAYWVPTMVDSLARSGDEIVRIGFAFESNGMGSLSPEFGHINRAGPDPLRKDNLLLYRLFTSLSAVEPDCGSPIINNAKEVVGMVFAIDPNSPPSQRREVAVPSRYVIAVAAKVKANKD